MDVRLFEKPFHHPLYQGRRGAAFPHVQILIILRILVRRFSFNRTFHICSSCVQIVSRHIHKLEPVSDLKVRETTIAFA
jgi:hypothetical protein